MSVHLLRPPASAATLLDSELLVRRKWNVAKSAIGSSVTAPFAHRARASESDEPAPSVPERTEKLHAILESWRRPVESGDRQFPSTHDAEPRRGDEILVASVVADRSGLVAVASVAGEPILIASLGESLSTDVDALIAACLLAGSKEVETHLAQYESAVVQIQNWFERESATAIAGVAGSSPLHRARLVNRIDAIIENSPPHLRASRSAVAASARSVATAPHSAAIEQELGSLAYSPLPDEEWLNAIAGLESKSSHDSALRSKSRNLRVHSMILLNRRHA